MNIDDMSNVADMDKELEDMEKDLSEVYDCPDIPPSDIVTFNELRSCADLVRMHEKKQLKIDPDFQRGIVWTNLEQTRFIDSLVKQLPIPSMCISLDYKTNERLMIDGLQRIHSVVRFLTEDNWKLSSRKELDRRISGKTMEMIKKENHELYERVENLSIPITTVRCNYDNQEHMQYMFIIFHRLNTGGSRLNSQEIRNCIFQGSFNDLLKKLAKSREFKKLISMGSGRFAHEEFILRFFAFHENLNDYDGNFNEFLNEYMKKMTKNKCMELIECKEKLFRETTGLMIHKMISGGKLPRLAKATKESIYVAVASNLGALEKESSEKTRQRLARLLEDPLFSRENLKAGLSGRTQVVERIKRAIYIFS